MPEICEVCLTSQYLSLIIGHDITKIKILGGRYAKKPIKGLTSLKFPLRISSIHTKGKFMWFVLNHNNETYYMLNTFGLTGKWSYDNIEYSRIKFTIHRDTKKYNLYFSDVRNFGAIEFTTNINVLEQKLIKLAPDFLQSPFTDKEFMDTVASLKNKNKKIVSVLMSQNTRDGIGSGLGNYLVPEILYRAGISPHRPINSLSTTDLININKSIKYHLRLCYMRNTTEYISHMKAFLLMHSDGIKNGKYPDFLDKIKIGKDKLTFKVYRKTVDENGNPVIGESIIPGRTTYWVPNIQV